MCYDNSVAAEVWLSWLEHSLHMRGVIGSSPIISTIWLYASGNAFFDRMSVLGAYFLT